MGLLGLQNIRFLILNLHTGELAIDLLQIGIFLVSLLTILYECR